MSSRQVKNDDAEAVFLGNWIQVLWGTEADKIHLPMIVCLTADNAIEHLYFANRHDIMHTNQ